MSNSAFAYQNQWNRVPQPRSRRHARHATARVSVPLASIVLQEAAAVSQKLGWIKRPPSDVIAFSAAALLLHALAAWYISTHTHAAAPKPKHEVTLEIVPPKPPEPKIEPPKPLPQKPQPIQKTAKVLPSIQTPAPVPSDTPALPSSEPPLAVPPVVSAPVAEEPAPVTPPFGAAGYLNNPPPDYPPAAARAGWEGVVKLRVHVLSNGQVDVVEIQKSSGRKILDDEAARTVKRWTFTPSKRGDTPIDGWANVPIEFTLE